MTDTSRLVEAWRRTGGPLAFRIVSGSMWPTLHTGDTVEVVPTTRFLPGDVLLLHRNEDYIVHRLVTPWPRPLTWGDATTKLDPPWQANQLMGRVVARWHAGHRRPIAGFPFSVAQLAICPLRRISRRVARLGLLLLLAPHSPVSGPLRATLRLAPSGRELLARIDRRTA